MIRSLLIAVLVCFAAPALATTLEVFSNSLNYYENGVLLEQDWEVFLPSDGLITGVSGLQGNTPITFQNDPDPSDFAPFGEWYHESFTQTPIGTSNTVSYTSPTGSGTVAWTRSTTHTVGPLPIITFEQNQGSTVTVNWDCNGGCTPGAGPFDALELDLLLFDSTGEEELLVETVWFGLGEPEFGSFDFENVADGEYLLAIEIFTLADVVPFNVDSFDSTGSDFTVHTAASRLHGGFGTVTVVPEPSTGLLMGMGLFGLARFGRKLGKDVSENALD